MSIAMAKRSYFNDPHCGDETSYWQAGSSVMLCVVDGLGHGEHAETAAKAAIAYVGDHLSESLPDIFAGCDAALRSTRGAVMGITVIDRAASTLTYAGIGNTQIRIIGEAAGRVGSDSGIIGGGYRRLSPRTVPIAPGELVIMFTDGVANRLDVSTYDGSVQSDLQQLADRIIEDWARKTDDAAVLIFRYESS